MDLTIGKINLKKKELPEKISKIDDALKDSVAGLEAERIRVDELQKNHKENEEKLKRGIENLKKIKDRLYEVKTNKEYQAILKEIETIEKKNSEIEDDIIVALEELDKAREQFKSNDTEFESSRLKHEHDKKKMEDELDLLDTELLSCQQKTDAFAKQIWEHLLKRYEIIKGKRNGLAVVSVWKEVCEGCHVNIPPQLYNELQQTTELISCPNCNRILYWHNKDKKDE